MKIFKKIFSVVLRLIISVVLLVFLFRQVDFKNVLGIIKNSNFFLITCAFFLNLFLGVLSFLRWNIVLKSLNLHVPIKRLISVFCGSLFFNTFLPTSIGGDFVRSVDLSLYTKRPSDVVASVFLDRLSGYIGTVLILILAVILSKHVDLEPAIWYSIIGICLFLILILVVLFNNRIYKKINFLLYSPKAGKIRSTIHGIHEKVHFFKKQKKKFFYALLISFTIQFLSTVIVFIVSLAVGINVSLIYFIIFIPIVGMLTLLPISFGGWGVREMSFVFFMTKIGVDNHLALANILIGTIFVLIFTGIAGIVYVFTLHNRRLQSN